MQIIITSKNIEGGLGEMVEASIQKKVGGLSKLIRGFENHASAGAEELNLFKAFVDVKRDSNHHNKGKVYIAEIKMSLPGRTLFSKADGENVMRAVLEAREEMESEIRHYKTKLTEVPRRKNRKAAGLE